MRRPRPARNARARVPVCLPRVSPCAAHDQASAPESASRPLPRSPCFLPARGSSGMVWRSSLCEDICWNASSTPPTRRCWSRCAAPRPSRPLRRGKDAPWPRARCYAATRPGKPSSTKAGTPTGAVGLCGGNSASRTGACRWASSTAARAQPPFQNAMAAASARCRLFFQRIFREIMAVRLREMGAKLAELKRRRALPPPPRHRARPQRPNQELGGIAHGCASPRRQARPQGHPH